MSELVFMEYMGFKSTTQGREYAFHVRFSPQDRRDYIVTIPSETFASHRVSYQDGPNVCSSRLKLELTVNPGCPTGTAFLIEEKDIDDQKLGRDLGRSRAPKLGKAPQKPADSMDKRQKPVVYCPSCGKRSFDIQLSNKRCVQRINDERCFGIAISATGVNDWMECAACSGSGWINGARCDQCANSGWLFVRRGR